MTRTLEEIVQESDVGNLTLEEELQMAEAALLIAAEKASLGVTWTPKLLAASYKPCVTVDRLLSCLAAVTGGYSRLQFWMVTNDYARTHTVRQSLQSFTLGSALLRELIDQLATMIEACDDLDELIASYENHIDEPIPF